MLRKPNIRFLTEAEWQRAAPLLSGTRAGKWPLRALLDAMLHKQRSGCQWRNLPACFPPWQAVHYRFLKWRENGTWQLLTGQLPTHYQRPAARPVAPDGPRHPVINLGWIKHARLSRAAQPTL